MTVKPPRPPQLPTQLSSDQNQPIPTDGDTLSQVKVGDQAWSGLNVRGLGIEESVFDHTDLGASQLKGLGVSDAKFDHCLLFAMNADDSSWRRTEIEHSNAAGLVLSQAKLIDITFRDTQLEGANFRFAELQRVQFSNCRLKAADFQSARLTDVSFNNCELDETSFAGVTANSVDLTRSDVGSIKGLSGLKGATVTKVQLIQLAPLMAAELGLVVEVVT